MDKKQEQNGTKVRICEHKCFYIPGGRGAFSIILGLASSASLPFTRIQTYYIPLLQHPLFSFHERNLVWALRNTKSSKHWLVFYCIYLYKSFLQSWSRIKRFNEWDVWYKHVHICDYDVLLQSSCSFLVERGFCRSSWPYYAFEHVLSNIDWMIEFPCNVLRCLWFECVKAKSIFLVCCNIQLNYHYYYCFSFLYSF